jgi:glycosyltransferase involved in cell wall biosynthesis
MSDPVRLSAVIPAFNEELGISGVVSGLRDALTRAGYGEEDFEVLVVDDGSSDRTADEAREAGARVLSHPVNRGYGRALLTGFSMSRFPWVLMIDADGSYPPEEALRLVEACPGFDMVVGARQGSLFWGTAFQAFRRWVFLTMAGFVAGEDIPDANSGLRLIRKEALDHSLPVLCYGYSLSTTMTLSFLQGGRFVRFVPIRYVERKGASKVRSLRDVPRTLQIMVQVILFFNPLKFAVVLAAVPGAVALAGLGAFLLSPRAGWLLLSALGLGGALVVFLLGCVLDVMRLREPSGRSRWGAR